MAARAPRKPSPRHAEITGVALDLAFEVGPARVSTGMIAERLGISQPAVYKHFRKKQDIWIAVGEDIAGRIAAITVSAQDVARPVEERIGALVLDHLRLIESVPALPDIMLLRDADQSLRPLRDQIIAAMAAYRAQMISLVREACESGVFASHVDPEDATSLLIGLIQSLVLRMVLSRSRGALVRDGERLLALLLQGFACRAPGAAG